MAKKTKAAADEDIYAMEDVKDFRVLNNVEQWRVRWKGYGSKDDTWEPRRNLMDPGSDTEQRMESLRKNYYEKKAKRKSLEAKKSPARTKATAVKTASKARSQSPARSNKLSTLRSPRSSARLVSSPKRQGERAPSPANLKRKAPEDSPASRKEARTDVARNLAASKEALEHVRRVLENDEAFEDEELDEDETSEDYIPVPVVTHIGKPKNGGSGDVNNYNVTIEGAGWQTLHITVGEAKEKYKDELLSYLLNRIKFRDSAPKC